MAHEIDFLAVGGGERSGDAIALRYGDGHTYSIHVIDGGDQAAGVQMVKHIRKYYENPSYIDAVVCTHGDDDHGSGLREVINEFEVGGIWMNRPWLYARSIINDFKDRRMMVDSLVGRLRDEYPILVEIEEVAEERGIDIHEAFRGASVGAFTVLAPSRERYLQLIPEFSRTPEQAESHRSDSSAPRGLLAKAAQSVRGAAEWVFETWGRETLEENVETSPSNESSVVQLARLDGERILLTGDAGVIARRRSRRLRQSSGMRPARDRLHASTPSREPPQCEPFVPRPLAGPVPPRWRIQRHRCVRVSSEGNQDTPKEKGGQRVHAPRRRGLLNQWNIHSASSRNAATPRLGTRQSSQIL